MNEYGNVWKRMEIHTQVWTNMEMSGKYEIRWKFVETYGNQSKCIALHCTARSTPRQWRVLLIDRAVTATKGQQYCEPNCPAPKIN